jgi:hypothetical protein
MIVGSPFRLVQVGLWCQQRQIRSMDRRRWNATSAHRYSLLHVFTMRFAQFLPKYHGESMEEKHVSIETTVHNLVAFRCNDATNPLSKVVYLGKNCSGVGTDDQCIDELGCVDWSPSNRNSLLYDTKGLKKFY